MMQPAVPQVILVEDDAALGQATAQALQLSGMEVTLYPDARLALKSLGTDFPGVLVSDVRLPGMDGLALFEAVREIDPEIPVILITGHGDVSMAVAAIKDGAADFLTKPFATADLLRSVEQAAQRRALVLENRRLRAALKQRGPDRLLGSSAAAEQLRNVIAAVARAEVDTVIEGELGTGKSFTARVIHDLSPRRDRPFVTIDAAVLAHSDAELLIFGREPGSGLSRSGLLERAAGGTLLLDEIDAVGGPLLARLIAALQTRTFLPVGADRPRKLHCRIIAACLPLTAPDSGPNQVAHKLGAVQIKLPPLAARREDLAELFRFFVAQHESELGLQPRAIGAGEWRRIQTHSWPGNLRELSNYARAFVLGLSTPETQPGAGEKSLADLLADFERSVLSDALRAAGGNVAKVQATLRTPRKTLYDRLARHGLQPRDFR